MSNTRVREAIDDLTFKDVRSTTLERIRLTLEADDCVRGLPQPRQLGAGLQYLLERISTPLEPHDLIAGRITEEIPDEAGEALFERALERWGNRTLPPWMRDGGHECFAWDRLLNLGLPGLESFARQQLSSREQAENGATDTLDWLRAAKAAPIDDPAGTDSRAATLDWLQGAVEVYGALRTFARRYAEAAANAGLPDVAARCAAADTRAPRTMGEALQLMWVVGLPYCAMASANPTLTFGRLDELLGPFYRRDLANRHLTREAAGDLIEDFYCKNNLILGRGEHQMGGSSDKDTGWARNLTYDAPQYVVLGGRRADDSPVADDLTALCLERVVPRFENPVMVLRYTRDLPEPVWRLACEQMRANASMMVYSDENIVPAMEAAGFSPERAVTYTMHGCNWPDIPGVQRTTMTHFLQLPRLLRACLVETEAGPADLDGVYGALQAALAADLDVAFAGERLRRQAWDADAPGLLRIDDCLLDGPVERGRSWACGGVEYTHAVVSICGLATAADMLAALEACSLSTGDAAGGGAPLVEVIAAMETDFDGREDLRQMLLAAPKFGQDDERADGHAVRLLELTLGHVSSARRAGEADEVPAFHCLETDMRHRPFGADLGATPDGRRAGEPISENTSPTPGACHRGLTAMLRSMAKLPFHRIHSGALNLRLQPRLFAGDGGLDRLAQVLRTYFDLGGLQAQLSLASVEELRDAQAHPEQHRDLMVRITGYSAAFVDMTTEAQEEIIRREEMAP